MMKTFKYRIFPENRQRKLLNLMLLECCWLYNKLLEQRKTLYETHKQSVSYYDQKKKIPELKIQRPTLKNVHSQTLQNVVMRIELAFQSFFRRIKEKEIPGYPRFKSGCRYSSLTFGQFDKTGCRLINGKLAVSKVGDIKIKIHRPLQGTPKIATITRSSTGKWYVSIVCDIQPHLLPISNMNIGIDMGLENFATTHDGQVIENPKFFRNSEKKLAKVQRKLSKCATGTSERTKARKAVARVHERIAWKRDNFCHQESRKVINKYQIICTENLNIKKMSESVVIGRNKSIRDVAWGAFLNMISAKAVEAGRMHVKVNPAYTSQDCSGCNKNRQKMPSHIRIYRCPKCGLELHRDVNAARNIFRLGMQSLA